MILKIATGSGTGAWRFIDKISEVNVRPTSPEIYNKEYAGHGRYFDLVELNYVVSTDGNATLLFQEGVPLPKAPDNIVKEIWTNRNGDNYNILLDVECYLMSDEGKTIERIN